MSSAKLKIVQIVVEVDGGELCAVSLPEDRREILLCLIATLSEEPIKIARLPGVKMIPISELEGVGG
ncbi:hypothetical protein GTZ99_12580 [Novosphingobium sp. FSY-8]|uniref:Transcriptional regulator n=1 Tax=Novosphingobium ovatum TaxID=1908523 RepID=A0ABW9XFS1_9SPHN|nr:hypothetical protein [Novosphingobium ovatum]NBC37387.1 hypothetical protein [Novosphingobium ovatum]